MEIKLPYTIVNGGEKLTFTRIYLRDGVKVLEAFSEVQPKAGPPMHIHHRQDESFTIMSGKMAYQVAEEKPRYAYPGQTILIKAGTPHKFWNAGDDVMVLKGYVTPPDNFIYFLSEIYRSINEHNGKPGMYDAAYLLNRYRSEFAMTEIPSFVQRFIFPVILFVGNLVGRNKKFTGAPVPVK
jgi:mannose-6-phosphate isomerase-like protein (cupin superfamily)